MLLCCLLYVHIFLTVIMTRKRRRLVLRIGGYLKESMGWFRRHFSIYSESATYYIGQKRHQYHYLSFVYIAPNTPLVHGLVISGQLSIPELQSLSGDPRKIYDRASGNVLMHDNCAWLCESRLGPSWRRLYLNGRQFFLFQEKASPRDSATMRNMFALPLSTRLQHNQSQPVLRRMSYTCQLPI
jgi:hypothetical protein